MKPGDILRLCATVCSLGWLLLASSTAFADTYQVSACNYAPEAANNSWEWSTTDTSQPAHYAKHTNCPDRTGGIGGTSDQEGGLSTTDALGLSDGAPPATSAGWRTTAPTGTTIVGLEYERYIGHIYDSNNYWAPALRADGTPIAGESCLDTIANSETCYVGGPPGEGDEPGILIGLSAHQLELGILCQAPTGQECITGSTQYKTWAAMYGAKVTLQDPTPPTLTTPTGTLWETGTASGYHKGTESLTVSAEDMGGGVQSIVLSADGQPLQRYTATCDFTFTQPCPLSTGPKTFTIPTTSLADGTHILTLTAVDAAGNQSAVATKQIVIGNSPPLPPTELIATPTQPDGSIFTATWTDPPHQVAPIVSATYQICPANGSYVCSAPEAAPAEGPIAFRVPGPGTWRLAVWLTDAAGNSDPANPAYTTLTVPVSSQNGLGAGQSSEGENDLGKGTSNTGPNNTESAGSKVTLSLSERLHRRRLVIHVSGPLAGEVRVSYVARYHKKAIASKVKKLALKDGQLTTTFRLTTRVAAHTVIRVSVRLGRQPTVNSTLSR